MKITRLLIVGILLFSLHESISQGSPCTNSVKFQYSIGYSLLNTGLGEIHLTNLDQSQKVVWHLISISNSFERKYIEANVLKDIPVGEYKLIVRDQRPQGNCPVVESIVINK